MTTVSSVGNADLARMLDKTRDAAAGGFTSLSTAEALAAALILNRSDWLDGMKFTIAEALEGIGPDWARLIPAAANEFQKEREAAEYEAAIKTHEAKVAKFTERASGEDATLEFSAKFVTSSSAPGYRDVFLTFNLVPIGGFGNGGPRDHGRASLRLAEGCAHRRAARRATPLVDRCIAMRIVRRTMQGKCMDIRGFRDPSPWPGHRRGAVDRARQGDG